MKYLWQVLFVCANLRSVTIQTPIQPLPSIYLFYLASQSLCSAQAVQFTTSLCEMSPSLSLSRTQAFLPCLQQTEILTFSSIFHTQILWNTQFLCNQHNLHFIKILFHLHKCTRNNTTHPSANVCFLAKTSVIPLLSPACYHSLYVQRINVSPLLDAQMQKGNGAIWTEQCITLLFEQNQLSMQGTKQKEFSLPSLLILSLLGTSSTTEITQPFGRKPQGVHGEKTQPRPVGMCFVTVAVRKGDKPYIALGNGITLLIQAAKIHALTCRRLSVNS